VWPGTPTIITAGHTDYVGLPLLGSHYSGSFSFDNRPARGMLSVIEWRIVCHHEHGSDYEGCDEY